MKQVLIILLGAVALVGALFSEATAQVSYMDASGNIHFVDSPSQVPSQYREQVVPPTPIPKYDKKQIAEIKRQQRAAEVKKIREEKMKQREELRKKRLQEAELRKQEKENKRKQQNSRLESLAR
jgi:membrane protein involved in colicin uptake